MTIDERAQHIQLVIFDIDGVLSDGRLFFDENGQQYKAFHARDGLGAKMALHCGLKMAFITGRQSPLVNNRAEELGVEYVYQACSDKKAALNALIKRSGIAAKHMAFLGDDLIDLPALTRVGLAGTVADAHPDVVPHTHWQSQYKGGQGAAREFIELIIKARGQWDALMASYLS